MKVAKSSTLWHLLDTWKRQDCGTQSIQPQSTFTLPLYEQLRLQPVNISPNPKLDTPQTGWVSPKKAMEA